MRWPLHYQILVATLAGAVLGLLLNPGATALPDATFRRGTNGAGQLEELVAGTTDDDPSPVLIVAPGGEDERLARLQGGEVLGRRVRFRSEKTGVQAVYSRFYRDRSGLEIPMISRIALGEVTKLKESDAWLVPGFERYESSLGRVAERVSRWLGGVFLRLLKMVTVPLIATSLITAVSGLGARGRMGGLLGTTLVYYLVTSVLAITTGIVLVNVVAPGVGAELPGAAAEVVGGEGQSLAGIFESLIEKLIPTNPLASVAGGDFLSIISFSILFGVFLGGIQRGEPESEVVRAGATVSRFVEGAFSVMMRMTTAVIRLAPLGVAAFMLSATVSQGAEVFGTLGWYMLTVALALAIHALVVLPLVVRFVAGRSPWEYAKSLSPALLTAFSTASSNGTLPLTMSSVAERAGLPRRVGAFVLPLGATINMDGTALYEAVAVLFIAQATPGVELGLHQQILVAVTALLASVGAAGIPHAGLVMMAIVLQAVGLPLEAQGVILAVDRMLDMCRTSVNVWSDACGCAVVARFHRGSEEELTAG